MEWTRKNIYEKVKIMRPEEEMVPYKKFCAIIFFQPGGKTLRLCHDGVDTLKKFFPYYTVEILDEAHSREKMPSKHYVFLTRYCKAPYYIGSKNIVFFDEDEALIFKLCDGDIDNVKNVSE